MARVAERSGRMEEIKATCLRQTNTLAGIGPRWFYGARENRLNVVLVLPSREGTEPLVEARLEV